MDFFNIIYTNFRLVTFEIYVLICTMLFSQDFNIVRDYNSVSACKVILSQFARIGLDVPTNNIMQLLCCFRLIHFEVIHFKLTGIMFTS